MMMVLRKSFARCDRKGKPHMSQSVETLEMNRRKRRGDTERILLMALFARMDNSAMAVATGAVGALVLFLATAVLVLKGAPPGMSVGPHLAALSTFLPGYAVSWPGAVVGAAYGFLVGAAAGFVLAVLWNFTHLVFIGFAVMKEGWLD